MECNYSFLYSAVLVELLNSFNFFLNSFKFKVECDLCPRQSVSYLACEDLFKVNERKNGHVSIYIKDNSLMSADFVNSFMHNDEKLPNIL